jgi:hypothetical protein
MKQQIIQLFDFFVLIALSVAIVSLLVRAGLQFPI